MNIFEILIEIIVIVAIIGSAIVYISFLTSRKKIRETYSNIENKLKRRWELLPEFAEIVKKYHNYDEAVLEKLTALRNQDYNKFPMKQRIEIDDNISKVISKIIEISENNQEIIANEQYIEIVNELMNLEEEITEFKDSYIKEVKSYNKEMLLQ